MRFSRVKSWSPAALILLLVTAATAGHGESFTSPAADSTAPSSLPANITVDVAKRGPTIGPGLFGQNGAVWMSMNDTIAKLTNESGASIIRWPGGETTDYYDWEADSGNGRVYHDDGTYWSPIYNSDTFIDFCRKTSCTPMISANAVIADPQKAARWAQYFLNKSLPVKLWQIGNEPVFDKHWNVSLPDFKTSDNSQPTTDEWAWVTREYANALRAVDPEIKVIGPDGGAAEGSRDDIWVGEFTRKARDAIDYVDIHSYPANGMNEADMLATPDSGPDGGLVSRIRKAQAMIAGNSSGKQLPLTMTEYNSDWNNGALMGSWVNGLYIADVLLHLAEENVTIANLWNLASQNEGYIDPNGTPRSSYWAFRLLRQEFSGNVISATSDADANGYGLESHAAVRSDGAITLAVINKRKTQSYDAAVSLGSFLPEANATVYLLDRTHDATRIADASLNGTSFTYRFLPYSLTLFVIHPRQLPKLSVIAGATPPNGTAPLTVKFTSLVTGGQGQLAYVWDFGDGKSDIVPDPAHIYPSPGNYSAVVTVQDSAGRNASDSIMITAEKPPDPPPPVAPPAPTGLEGAWNGSAAILNWKHVWTNVTFIVYRQQGAAWTRLNSVPLLTAGYSDEAVTGGRNYSYSVSALSVAGKESARSSPVTVPVPDAQPPAPTPPPPAPGYAWPVSTWVVLALAIIGLIAIVVAILLVIRDRRLRGLQ